MPQGYEKKGKELLSKLGRSIKIGAEALVQETKELTRIGKLKVELISLENERGKKFEEIGRLAHTLYKQEAGFERLTEHFTLVDEIEAKIDAKNKEIESTGELADIPKKDADLTGASEDSDHDRWCSQCGSPVGRDDKFCSKCGNQLN